MDAQTWGPIMAVLVGFAGVVIALASFMRGMRTELKSELTKLDGKIDKIHVELKGEIAELRVELNGKIDKIHVELKREIDKAREELKGEIDKNHEELKGEIAELRVDYRFLSQTVIGFVSGSSPPRAQAQGE